jgi:aspartyl-tRNA(Asn)/glutamyl-tRNA(Gln) amidotransferase subunit B
MQRYRTVIGLEVHVQLGTATKLFSPAPVASGGEPNTRVDIYDLGLPGVLPALNRRAVELAVRAALALDGAVQRHTRFDRKNFFYPDLPKGYQISQYAEPYCVGGRVPLGDGRWCALERIHLEEDAGKNIHTGHGSLIDLNRAGVALCEIVSAPELHTPADAHAFLEQLKQILQYAGVSECDMENGSLRCDANISVMAADASELGTKVEIKNLNSFKMVQRALEYEERRQRAILAAGGRVAQETRLWNDEKAESASMRSKESAHDYRYFPDPDLPLLEIPESVVARIRATMPELPAARRERFARQYELPDYDIGVLTADRDLADYFETVATACGDAKSASNWVMTEVARALNESGVRIASFAIGPERLAELVVAQNTERVSRLAAKKVFTEMLRTGCDAATAIGRLDLGQISDPDVLAAVVDRVLAANHVAVAEYRGGKQKVLHALKGLCMKETGGKANPALAERLLLERLDDQRR